MRARRVTAAALLVSTVLLVSGCTDGEPAAEPSRTSTAAGSETTTPEGPTPQELSEEVLAAAEAEQDAPAIASGTGTFANGTTLDVEVVSLVRSDTGVLLTARLSGAGDKLGPAELKSARNDGLSFARDLYLVDSTVSRSRYLPLQFTDYRQACVCPYVPFELGAQPQTVTALYPPLPDGVTTVDLVINDQVTVADVPVSG